MLLLGDGMLEPTCTGQGIAVSRLELLYVRDGVRGSQGVPVYWLPLGKPAKWAKGVQTASADLAAFSC